VIGSELVSVLGTQTVERPEQLALGLEILDDRLDHQVAVGQLLHGCREGHTTERGIASGSTELAIFHGIDKRVLDPLPPRTEK